MALYQTDGTLVSGTGNILSKADKVTSATNGDLASLDANGNLVDSGISKNAINLRGIGQYVKTGLSSAGWYKIYEGATHNQGEILRIDLGSFYNNTQNCGHAIDITYGYKATSISETCRDNQSVFSKIRVCYQESPNTSKNTILVYYTPNSGNAVYANILSTQNDNNGEAFNFVAVDASQYTTYNEFYLGTNGLYVNGVGINGRALTITNDTDTYVTNNYSTAAQSGKVVQVTVNIVVSAMTSAQANGRILIEGLPNPILTTTNDNIFLLSQAWSANKVIQASVYYNSSGNGYIGLRTSQAIDAGQYIGTITYIAR